MVTAIIELLISLETVKIKQNCYNFTFSYKNTFKTIHQFINYKYCLFIEKKYFLFINFNAICYSYGHSFV